MSNWKTMSAGKKKKTVLQNLQAYSFMLPNLILFTACSLYPVVWTLKYVFYQYG